MKVVLEFLRVDVVSATGCEHLVELFDNKLAAMIVEARPTPSAVDNGFAVSNAELQPLHAVGDVEVAAQWALTLAHGSTHHIDHAEVALDPSDVDRVIAADTGVWNEVAKHAEFDARLAERWQHLFDIGQEEPVWANDHYALAGKRETMAVQQVRGTMERDHGFAGARSALHDDGASEGSTDDLVLFTLDSADDVAEASGTALFQRCDQRAFALESSSFAAFAGEVFVFDAEQFSVAGYVVAAAAEPHGLAAGCTVERFCDWRPPVDDHRVAVLVENGDATDMEMVTFGLINTPEDQRLVADIQVFESGSHLVGEDVSFVTSLVGAALARFDIVGDTFRCLA